MWGHPKSTSCPKSLDVFLEIPSLWIVPSPPLLDSTDVSIYALHIVYTRPSRLPLGVLPCTTTFSCFFLFFCPSLTSFMHLVGSLAIARPGAGALSCTPPWFLRPEGVSETCFVFWLCLQGVCDRLGLSSSCPTLDFQHDNPIVISLLFFSCSFRCYESPRCRVKPRLRVFLFRVLLRRILGDAGLIRYSSFLLSICQCASPLPPGCCRARVAQLCRGPNHPDL